MRGTKYNFQWFEREDKRKALCASVSQDGKLHLGKSLRKVLPPFIRIGFDSNAMVLAIADGHGVGTNYPACGVLTAQALTAKISSTGLNLPVSFRLEQDERTGYFLGRIHHRRKIDQAGELRLDIKQLLVTCRPILDSVVYQMGRSTPLAERKLVAEEALCTAARDYRPGYGDVETYVESCVKDMILKENRQYIETYPQHSLEQSISTEKDDFCLLDTIADKSSDWVCALDNQVDMENFCDQLPPDQRDMIQMLRSGFQISEIMDIMGVSEREFRHMAFEIAQQHRQFDGVAC